MGRFGFVKPWHTATISSRESSPRKIFAFFGNIMSEILLSWLRSWFSNDKAPAITISVLRIPPNDSEPHILPLWTIDASAEENVDSCFTRIPDMRAFWGAGEGWRLRDVLQCTITDENPNINGVYLAWRSFAVDILPLNKNASGCGDVFIAKLKDPECDEDDWTAYEDVSDELLDSGLYRRVLKRLSEN